MTYRGIVAGLSVTLMLGLASGPAYAGMSVRPTSTAGHGQSASIALAGGPAGSARVVPEADWVAYRDITFPDGWALGGWGSLTLRDDGSYHFQGHMHDSGGVSYDFGAVWAIRQPDGTVLTFATTGHMSGTCFWFSCDGSRDYDWDMSGTRADVAAAKQTGFTGMTNATASLDLVSIFDGIKKGFDTISRVVAIVGPALA